VGGVLQRDTAGEDRPVLRGRVTTGQGRGAGFTGLPWARAAFRTGLGIEPFPGTLNLRLASAADLWAWGRLRQQPGVPVPAPGPDQCDAVCYPVLLAGRVPGAIVLPRIRGYAPDQLEIIAPLALRRVLGLADGDEVTVECQGMPRLEALVFDVDGTLVDSLEGYRLAALRAAAHLKDRISRDAVRAAMNRNESFWDQVLAGTPEHSPSRVEALRAATLEHWPRVLREHVRCFPGIETTLRLLRERGLRLAICTGSRGESFRPLEEQGLLEHFEVVVTAADVKERKPHPEGLLRCLDALGVAPEAAAYVGDSMLDMAAGRAAGMLAIGVLSGAGTSAELAEAGAHRLVPDQGALPGLLGPAAAS
jgi:HAD superfamily hydrolase (TIGR01509 family)